MTDTDDVLRVLAPDKLEQAALDVFGDNELENKILELIKKGVRDGDDIATELKITASEFGQAITMMEVKGMVRALGANKWAS